MYKEKENKKKLTIFSTEYFKNNCFMINVFLNI